MVQVDYSVVSYIYTLIETIYRILSISNSNVFYTNYKFSSSSNQGLCSFSFGLMALLFFSHNGENHPISNSHHKLLFFCHIIQALTIVKVIEKNTKYIVMPTSNTFGLNVGNTNENNMPHAINKLRKYVQIKCSLHQL